jgi:hypothetical protein
VDQVSAGLWALLIFGWFAASVAYRLVAGKAIFASANGDAVFVERWSSGRAGAGLLAKLSAGRNCLQVQITPTELIVTPHFPFTLGFLPEIYDFDARVKLQDVQSAVLLGGAFVQAVEVIYRNGADESCTLQLLLRRGGEFASSMLALKNAA